MDVRTIRREAQSRLENTAYCPKKLALIHAGAAIVCSLVLTVINLILSRQMTGTGGLAGMGTRAVLESAQSVLSLGFSLAMPFWTYGFVAAALNMARGQEFGPKDLLQGFLRFGPLLRLMLLQALVYALVAFLAIQIGSIVATVTPLGADLMAVAQTQLAGNIAYLEQGILSEEVAMQILAAAVPVYIVILAVFALLCIPVSYRLRLAPYMIMDGQNGAFKAMTTSNRTMKGKCFGFFKLDLGFWWYWGLQLACSLLAFWDLLLPALGINLPMDGTVAMFLFFLLQSLASLAIAWAWQSRVETTYAMAYDELKEE